MPLAAGLPERAVQRQPQSSVVDAPQQQRQQQEGLQTQQGAQGFRFSAPGRVRQSDLQAVAGFVHSVFDLSAEYRLRMIGASAHCPHCSLYLGCSLQDIMPLFALGPRSRLLYAVKAALLGRTLVPHNMVIPVRPDGRHEPALEPRLLQHNPWKEYRCCNQVQGPAQAGKSRPTSLPAPAAAAGGNPSPGDGMAAPTATTVGGTPVAQEGGAAAIAGRGEGTARHKCGALLFHRRDILSRQHTWNLGRGRRTAYLVNHLAPGHVVGPPREEGLAQGRMVVADVACGACGTAVGWKFVEDLQGGNTCQVGRFGVVTSVFGGEQLGIPSLIDSLVYESSDTELEGE